MWIRERVLYGDIIGGNAVSGEQGFGVGLGAGAGITDGNAQALDIGQGLDGVLPGSYSILRADETKEKFVCRLPLDINVIDVIIQRQLNIYVKKTYCLLGSTLHNESFF